jgi:hypothetical protein
MNSISRSFVSHLTNGMVGFGITSGRGLGTAVGVGLLPGVVVGSGEVWTTGVGLGPAATGGVAPVVQAASKTIANVPEASPERLMVSQRCGSTRRYALLSDYTRLI